MDTYGIQLYRGEAAQAVALHFSVHVAPSPLLCVVGQAVALHVWHWQSSALGFFVQKRVYRTRYIAFGTSRYVHRVWYIAFGTSRSVHRSSPSHRVLYIAFRYLACLLVS